MSALWLGIVLSAAGCFALKIAGLSVPERVLAHPLTVRVSDLIPVALLGALIAVQVFADDSRVVVDARLAALGVAALLLWLRVPFLPMVALAALTAAGLRAL
ncbi:AzlD domain-containing protein [Aeromicrobium sp. CF3.5]|uniref:AzlD domain-containing protein n=1 Tax=Aeromicrobium sp. CF3.5 TaxID=3373078 RepID=UPI003EE7F44D